MAVEEGRTVYVLWPVEVDAEDATVGQGEYEDVVGNLRRNEGRGDGELELHALNVEDGQPIVC